MVKCLPEFEYFYCVLKNKNIISKIRRSKVTDYAALNMKLFIYIGILQVLKLEFLTFRILEIWNFHPCICEQVRLR